MEKYEIQQYLMMIRQMCESLSHHFLLSFLPYYLRIYVFISLQSHMSCLCCCLCLVTVSILLLFFSSTLFIYWSQLEQLFHIFLQKLKDTVYEFKKKLRKCHKASNPWFYIDTDIWNKPTKHGKRDTQIGSHKSLSDISAIAYMYVSASVFAAKPQETICRHRQQSNRIQIIMDVTIDH
ncbi:hypothetical protein BLOT_014272 [Blomia tropicalis]|nr:hypothetical protein BLOT_014272 [Blomia tropicalis]